MSLSGIDKLEAKIKLLIKEHRRIQKLNQKYLLAFKEVQDEKKSLEIELQESHSQLGKVNQLQTHINKLEDEKTLLQAKLSSIVSDLDTLEFL